MLLSRLTTPAEFLSLAELKQHLRIDHAYEDATVDLYRFVAMQALDGLDGYLNRAICAQTWQWCLPCFPYGREIHFPLPPLRSVTSIQYYDTDANLQTFAAGNYLEYPNSNVGYLKLKPDASWPATFEFDDAVVITFVAGYGTPQQVPHPIKAAAKLLAARLYANRGDGDDSKNADGDRAMVETERRLLAPYRLQEFMSSNAQYWTETRARPHR